MIAGLPDRVPESPVCWAHGPRCDMTSDMCAPVDLSDPARFIGKPAQPGEPSLREIVEELMPEPRDESRLRWPWAALAIVTLSLLLWGALFAFGYWVDAAVGAMR